MFEESEASQWSVLFDTANIRYNYSLDMDYSEILEAVDRHRTGDWGESTEAEKEANEVALEHGGCVLSVFRDKNRKKFVVLTEYVKTESPFTHVLKYSNYLMMAG